MLERGKVSHVRPSAQTAAAPQWAWVKSSVFFCLFLHCKMTAVRAAVFHDFSCGNCSPAQCFERLRQTFGVWNTPSKRTSQRWFAEWRKERTEFKSLRHNSGRRRSPVTPKNIAAVDLIIINNPHATYKEIEHESSPGSGQCQLILRKILRVKKLCARWIPHQLTEEQKTARLEFCHAMLTRFDKPPKFQRLRDIVTGDETWGYYYDPRTRRMSMEWVREGQQRPV